MMTWHGMYKRCAGMCRHVQGWCGTKARLFREQRRHIRQSCGGRKVCGVVAVQPVRAAAVPELAVQQPALKALAEGLVAVAHWLPLCLQPLQGRQRGEDALQSSALHHARVRASVAVQLQAAQVPQLWMWEAWVWAEVALRLPTSGMVVTSQQPRHPSQHMAGKQCRSLLSSRAAHKAPTKRPQRAQQHLAHLSHL